MSNSDLPRGITKEKSSLGGFVVRWNDEIIGWIHEQQGGTWNAYQSATPPFEGRMLGSWPMADAILHVATEAGWQGATKPKAEG